MLLNKMLEEKRTNELGCVVVDEVHMMADAHRGFMIELLLAKLLRAGAAHVQVDNTNPQPATQL